MCEQNIQRRKGLNSFLKMKLFQSSDFGLILRLKEVQGTLQHELI